MPGERNALRRRAEALLGSLQAGVPVASAERTAQEAHALALEVDDRLLEAESLLQLARLQVSRRDPAERLAALQRAAAIFDVNRVADRAATCRVAMARALYDLAEERNAIAMAQAALREVALPVDERAIAVIQMALCHGHLGEIDEAMRLLRQEAGPLLIPGTPARVRALFDQALALMHLQVMICKRWPALWRGLTGIADVREPVPTPRALLMRLDAASAAPSAAARWGHAGIAAQVARGLLGEPGDPADAVAALGAIAEAREASSPVVAGWALYGQALVWRRLGQHRAALAVMARALALAQSAGATLLVRDLLLQISRSHDALGDAASALVAYRQAVQMRLRGLLLSRPVGSVEAPLDTAHRLRALEPAHVRRAVRFIQERLLDDIDVSDVVTHCGVGRRTLETAFRASRGVTMAQFIKSMRLDRAADLLRHSDRSVQDVARSVGYRSPSAFAREFSLKFGAGPAAWRRSSATPMPPL